MKKLFWLLISALLVAIVLVACLTDWFTDNKLFRDTTITVVNVTFFVAAAGVLSRFLFDRLVAGAYPKSLLRRQVAVTGLGILQLAVLLSAASVMSTTQENHVVSHVWWFGLTQAILLATPILLGLCAWAIVMNEMQSEVDLDGVDNGPA